jgi:hypothetical protein
MSTRLALVLACGASAALSLEAADKPLIDGGAAAFETVWSEGLAKSLVDAPAQGGKALRLVVPSKPEQPWNAQTWVTPLLADIAAGDTVRITLSARCVAPSQSGEISVSVGLNADPWTETAAEKLDVGPEWKEYTITGVAQDALPAASGRFGFSVGYQVQTIEVAKIVVTDLGKK